MIRTLAARLLFALAAACALAASTGVAVPFHQEEPGTPAGHDHVLSAYRFGFLVPSLERHVALPTIKAAALSPIQDLAIEFALLVVLITRLARPARRVVAEFRLPHVPSPLWRVAPAIIPPRPAFFPHPAA